MTCKTSRGRSPPDAPGTTIHGRRRRRCSSTSKPRHTSTSRSSDRSTNFTRGWPGWRGSSTSSPRSCKKRSVEHLSAGAGGCAATSTSSSRIGASALSATPTGTWTPSGRISLPAAMLARARADPPGARPSRVSRHRTRPTAVCVILYRTGTRGRSLNATLGLERSAGFRWSRAGPVVRGSQLPGRLQHVHSEATRLEPVVGVDRSVEVEIELLLLDGEQAHGHRSPVPRA